MSDNHHEEEIPDFLSDEAIAKHEAEEKAKKQPKKGKKVKNKTFNQLVRSE